MYFAKLFTVALAAVSMAVPATAEGSNKNYPKEQGGGGKRCKPDESILDLLLCASGDSDFDDRKGDYDILRELVVFAGLVDAVAGLEDVTVFAPNDKAFKRLAEDLGYEEDNGYDENAVFAYLANALTELGNSLEISLEEVITTVILYHVADEEYSFKRLLKGKTVTTLQSGTIKASPNKKHKKVILNHKDTVTTDPRINDRYKNNKTSQGLVHTITRVLIPIDLGM
mmetsp:Transcript_29944/g.89056  ORF Transcript_29944/g.89056 Transcript_29944/m.89056 type:complete len:227 (-) Transcript_29944:184-864(-)|eukprot:CAMPEP_0113544488 /NCGR_PEP_ID=MMETSP0015_2-20120614/10737_1 /TAXON_ID=2838 /ORGANISM="Odontella" /LENGTH=226 /DNA_ID=CAMNT_0000444755 /DNA_START=44 /DNA_END=724 /DNA_ORIENTATION=+ /assembly_acc=CAM_ASM_000160